MRKVLVIGAAGGVGREVVSRLCKDGVAVIASVLDEAQKAELLAAHPDVEKILTIDLSRADHLIDALTSSLSNGDHLDAVIVCAAIAPYGPIETTPLASLRETLEINTLANVAAFQATIAHLRKSRGRLVFISSVAGRVAFPFVGHYSASKHALEALADAMRREVSKFGVHVILIEPGGIKTPMATSTLTAIETDCANLSGLNQALYADLFEAHRASVHQIKAHGLAPGDVADAVRSALSDQPPRARYIVGADAIQFCNLARTSSDEELDAMATIAATADVIAEEV